MTKIQIVMPPPADPDDPLEGALMRLTEMIGSRDASAVAHGLLGGKWSYGARFENDTFLMHPFCWCDKEGECPWCTGCRVYQERNQCKLCADPALDLKARRARKDEGCDYVIGRGIFARFAPWTLDHDTRYYDPPNFWHKQSNFRVVWYKWIGRDMVINKAPDIPLGRIFKECFATVAS